MRAEDEDRMKAASRSRWTEAKTRISQAEQDTDFDECMRLYDEGDDDPQLCEIAMPIDEAENWFAYA